MIFPALFLDQLLESFQKSLYSPILVTQVQDFLPFSLLFVFTTVIAARSLEIENLPL